MSPNTREFATELSALMKKHNANIIHWEADSLCHSGWFVLCVKGNTTEGCSIPIKVLSTAAIDEELKRRP